MATKTKEDEQTIEALHPDSGNMAQIRDILFGEAQRTNEQQFAALEKALGNAVDKLSERLSDVAEDIGTRISDLSTHMDNELEALENRLNDVEATTRSEANEQGQTLREAVEATSKSLQSEIKTVHKQVREDLAALDDKMTAREDLASYFAEVGERLRAGEAALNGSKSAATGGQKRGKADTPATSNGGTDQPDGDT